jgi:hypothetical protein
MDSLRGQFGRADYGDDQRDYDTGEEDAISEAPPSPVGQDERRMQVRAYNHWASQLGERNFPAIEDLDPSGLGDFGPYSVLLDFTAGIEDPAIQYLGAELAQECGAQEGFEKLSDVPSRSLLSRITDHYMQILANQAPIGFEAEFVNQRGATILYRGILLPYSSDDDTIDFIYGVINWKEMADQLTADELLLEIDQALDAEDDEAAVRAPDPMTDWADGPVVEGEAADGEAAVPANEDDLVGTGLSPFPAPAFGADLLAGGDDDYEEDGEEDDGDWDSPAPYASLLGTKGPAKKPALSLDEPLAYEPADEHAEYAPSSVPNVFEAPGYADDGYGYGAEDFAVAGSDGDMGLYDCLAAARELAQAARSCEDRSRSALYAAVGRAYDFSLAAEAAPEEFDELVSENGLTVQDRAPMTPVVKLVFGADYDKTRLTEYAAVLTHAHRLGIARGQLAGYLGQADGGLKGVVTAERRLRREEAGKPVEARDGPREALAKKLRNLEPHGFETIAGEGAEFGLVMIRRMADGSVAMIGEIEDDGALVERAARKLLAGS